MEPACGLLTSPLPPAAAQSPCPPLPLLPACPEHGQLEVLEKLLAVDPELAAARDCQGLLPISLALRAGPDRWEEAECLLHLGSYFPAGASPKERSAVADQLLDALALAGSPGSPQYAEIAAHVQLKTAQWRKVPNPCAGIGAALPAVLARSHSEAARLVACLPASDRARLQATLLSLHRAQRDTGMDLPPLVLPALLRGLFE